MGSQSQQKSAVLSLEASSDKQCRPNEPVHEISNNVVYAPCKASDQPAHTRNRIRALLVA